MLRPSPSADSARRRYHLNLARDSRRGSRAADAPRKPCTEPHREEYPLGLLNRPPSRSSSMSGSRVFRFLAPIVFVGAIAALAIYRNPWGRSSHSEAQIFQAPPIELAGRSDFFPRGVEALKTPGFRVAGVHYWGEGWNYNFWSNLKFEKLGDDLRRIKSLQFNTILCSVPWGLFQPSIQPIRYAEESYARLERLISAAQDHQLYVILRVGTPESIPEGVAGARYFVPNLLFDEKELDAYAELFGETARRLQRFDNLICLFFSWEDTVGWLSYAQQGPQPRLEFARKTPAIREWIASKSAEEWSRLWKADYRALEEIPIPAYGTAPFRDFLTFADERLIDVVLPRISKRVRERSKDVTLSYEVRIDSEPIEVDGRREWFDHHSTWKLADGYPLVSAYFAPFWHAENDGGPIPAESVRKNLVRLLDLFDEKAEGKPVFFDQFNFDDSTPAFAHNSRLGGEGEIAAFLEKSLPILRERSLGYSVWALDAYEGNVIYNSTFEIGLEGWESSTAAADRVTEVRRDAARREQYAVLPPGATIQQTMIAGWNPGAHSPNIPYTLRGLVRSPDGGTLLVRYEILEQGKWIEAGQTSLTPTPEWSERSTELPFHPNCRLSFTASSAGAIELDDLFLFNHVQDAAVYGPRGAKKGTRAEVLAKHNLEWMRSIGQIAQEFPSSYGAAELAALPDVHDDGWIEARARLPLHSPWFRPTLEVDCYLPEVPPWQEGNVLRLAESGRELAALPVRPGANLLRVVLEASPGDRVLVMKPERTRRAAEWIEGSADGRDLGVLLRSIRVVADERLPSQWTEEVTLPPGPELEIVGTVRDRNGQPLSAVDVALHLEGRIIHTARANAEGAFEIKLPVEPAKSAPQAKARVFVEALHPEAHLEGVAVR
ncbi:MAG: beta-galactosidase [Planctomycetes bacterium]|nr:beta-galactosidase [Planctomycetota bacterium]